MRIKLPRKDKPETYRKLEGEMKELLTANEIAKRILTENLGEKDIAKLVELHGYCVALESITAIEDQIRELLTELSSEAEEVRGVLANERKRW